MTKRYLVRWEFELDEVSPLAAAFGTWQAMLNPDRHMIFSVAEVIGDEPPVYGPFEDVVLWPETEKVERKPKQ